MKNNIVSRHLSTQDSLENKFENFSDLTPDEQDIVRYMYNFGEKMMTKKVVELTGRSRHHIGKALQRLTEVGILNWYGISKNNRNQYCNLVLYK
ncbi:hypothetical protein ACVRZS_05440 [Streptococcus ferus]|uniref:hypothetical protein n=1 Tax=Streptococcus ferus TaxID=1345 RepID=UPI00037F3E3F|nr:hypothetical protein [Streptococcus ferus]